MYKIKKYFFHIVLIITRLLNILIIGLVLLMIIPLILPVFDETTSFAYIHYLLKIDQTIRSFVSQNIPTSIKGRDISRFIIIFIGLILKIMIGGLSENLRYRIKVFRKKPILYGLKKKKNSLPILSALKSFLSSVKTKLKKIRYLKKSKRQRLLETFVKTKKELDKWGKELTFLSIDVVHSTEIKKGEDPSIVEHDFLAYKKFVQEKLSNNNCIKSNWTPDGAMGCFPKFELAFKAAREVINELETFNKTVKLIKNDFAVRCGINSGIIHFDESLSLEDISDRTIDIAAHIQKQAESTTIYVTKQSVKPLELHHYFLPADKNIAGYEIYKWRSRK